MDWFFRDILWHHQPSPLSDWRPRLSQNTAAFVQLCDRSDATMRQILHHLQDLSAAVELIQNETRTWTWTAAALLASGALLAALAAPDSKGLSFAVFGAAATFGAVALLCFIVRQKVLERPHVYKMNRLVEEFRLIVKELKNSLEEVKSSCGNVRKKSVGAEAIKFIRLEINLLELLSLTEKLRPASIVSCEPEQVEAVEKISDGFRRMKTDLETFYRPLEVKVHQQTDRRPQTETFHRFSGSKII
ncbi:uncharacterized protein LOC129355021 [Poeciliopsis prolifica]|uniref:uncharacterized protein LOC129355021 n=1 Tax=Poeciliopsis prolifica TaxID=188132 RepID=UPI0024141C74|nr:uncharacterized protein LOC129355021 [Poeciliopsis prolifica]